jgi:hypothetical protein
MDALLDGKITQKDIDNADAFILQIIKDKSILIGEDSCKILVKAREAWLKYLVEKDIEKSTKHFHEFGDHLKELFKLNHKSKLL